MLLIDDRRGSAELADYIRIPHTITRLQYGDFMIEGNGPDESPALIGIERKTITDLVASIQSGRLSGHQLIGMVNSYNYNDLLIEGLWRAEPKTGILQHYRKKRWRDVSPNKRKRYMAKGIYNYINTLSVKCGIIPVWTTDIEQTAHYVAAIHAWWTAKWSSHQSHQVQYNPTAQLRRPTTFQKVVQSFDGVGPEKCKLIVERYGNIGEFIAAGLDDLTVILGKKLALKVDKQIEGVK